MSTLRCRYSIVVPSEHGAFGRVVNVDESKGQQLNRDHYQWEANLKPPPLVPRDGLGHWGKQQTNCEGRQSARPQLFEGHNTG